MGAKWDFGGWATKNNILCSDGTTIRENAFADQNGEIVPLVWMHQHNDPENVLGHCVLENRKEGVYIKGSFNNTPKGKAMKEQVSHGDIRSLSIWANDLDRSERNDIFHGVIREVSLVLSPANKGARIDYPILEHSGDSIIDEAIIYSDSVIDVLSHADNQEEEEEKKEKSVEKKEEEPNMKEENEKDVEKREDDSRITSIDEVKKIYNSFNKKEKEAVNILVGLASKDQDNEDEEIDDEDDVEHSYIGGDEIMHKNVFEQDVERSNDYLSHADQEMILANAKKCGSFKDALRDYQEENDAIIAHSIDTTGMDVGTGNWRSDIPSGRPNQYGFNDPDMLFPDYRNITNQPVWISRNMDWVNVVMGGVHHTPFTRVKSVFADITEDEARAKGYLKAHEKKEQIFTLLKRTTDPQTIYKKQRMDRDDIVDITDFDVVSWIRSEMRVMLNEEIARAILIGDGRLSSSDDKIQEAHVRPIVTDVNLFNIKVPVAKSTDANKSIDENASINAKNTINAVLRARKNYKGSGNPIFFTTEDILTEMLLMEDDIGHKLYKSEAEVATALRVSRIVTVEVMEGQTVTIGASKYPLIGVIVNLSDYNVGVDKGGEINSFDDFDIDYNQYKYLIETRMSGALVKPFSAMTVYYNTPVVDEDDAQG